MAQGDDCLVFPKAKIKKMLESVKAQNNRGHDTLNGLFLIKSEKREEGCENIVSEKRAIVTYDIKLSELALQIAGQPL